MSLLILKRLTLKEIAMLIMTYLEQVGHQINTFEKNAKKALENNNSVEYKDIMRKKAELLASLAVQIVSYDFSGLPDAVKARINEQIAAFSASAKNSLELNSSWYMSALLFAEDHKEGAPNNFDVFLSELKGL